MRLTLRTMLAYLDGILEPADNQDLAKKVEDSEFATGLVHRIRDVMRRLRLGAPSLTDRGPRLDPNTVAEYLDNTLPSEQVADFERVCLDSDVHLAEVASCHQILTLVLGEPAEIDPMSRQRMYQIKDASAEVKAASSPAAGPPPPVVASSTTPPVLPPSQVGPDEDKPGMRRRRQKPTVPEYLRDGQEKQRWMPITALVVLVVCITVVVLMAKGQFEPHTPLGDMLVRWGLVKPALETEAGPIAASGVKEIAKKGNEVSPATETVEQPIKDSPVEQAAAPAREDAAVGAKPPVEESTTGVMNLPPPESAKMPTGVAPGEALESGTKAASTVNAELGNAAKSKPEAMPEVGTAKEPEAKPVAEAGALPPEPLGRLMSSDQVLLWNDADVGWTRVGSKQMLIPGRLLALPSYRPQVMLTIGVTLDILAGTQVDLLGSGPHELPGVRVLFGKLVMIPLPKAGSRMRVQFGDHSGEIIFTDSNSSAALDVRRIHVPGTNPESGPDHFAADLYAINGGIGWDEVVGGKAADTVRLAPGQRMGFDALLTSPPVAAKESPKWIVARPLTRLENGAATALAQTLQTDGPARVGLRELVLRPQKEVRWLAQRCLGYVGQFHDMVGALNDPARKLEWTDYIEQLCDAVARDSGSAVAVRQAITEQYPQHAAELYRMFWGYTDEDLQSGSDRELVDGLDSDQLAIRVMSIWNLTKATGLGKIYQPEQTAARRKQAAQRWRERLKANEIRLKASEEKVGAAARENAIETPPEPQ
jgi:hypothetical protein